MPAAELKAVDAATARASSTWSITSYGIAAARCRGSPTTRVAAGRSSTRRRRSRTRTPSRPAPSRQLKARRAHRADRHAGREPARRPVVDLRFHQPGPAGSAKAVHAATPSAWPSATAQPVRPAARAGAALHPAAAEDRQARHRRPAGQDRGEGVLRAEPQAGGAVRSRRSQELAEQLERAEGIQRRGIVLALLMRLKQICNHPSQWLGDGAWAEADSGKFGAPARDRRGDRRAAGEDAGLHPVPRDDRRRWPRSSATVFGRPAWCCTARPRSRSASDLVRRFQEDETVPFFVLSLKAGGTGLNLTAASHVVHFDRWWNPAVENQATDRAFRIGQTQERAGAQVRLPRHGRGEDRRADRVEARSCPTSCSTAAARSTLTEMKDDELLQAGRAGPQRGAEGDVIDGATTTMRWMAAYVPVAERRRQAEREMAKLAQEGAGRSRRSSIEGRTIATTFWGKAWCDNLEALQRLSRTACRAGAPTCATARWSICRSPPARSPRWSAARSSTR